MAAWRRLADGCSFALPAGHAAERKAEVVVQAQIAAPTDHHQRQQHGQVDGRKLDAAVQLDDAATAVQVVDVAVFLEDRPRSRESL